MKIFPIILVCLGSVLGPMEASASPPAKTPNIAIAEADFYVSPDGDDRNPGSSDAPFLTFFKARDAVRKLKQTKTTGDILVYFKGGQYVLKGTVDTPVTDIVLKGLTFTKGQRYSLQEGDAGTHSDWDIYDKDNALVRLRGAERVVVEACRFFNSGDNAIRLDLHCQNNLVRNNSISHMGRSGVVLCGYGPGTKYANKKNEVVNNHIHHMGRLHWNGIGIYVSMSGENRIAHNLVHHTNYSGIAFTGAKFWLLKDDYEREGRAVRWHEIGNIDIFSASRLLPYNYTIGNILENNEVHHPLMELADGNCIYTNTSGKGNIVRNNYVHHLGGQHTKQSGWAIRTDDYVIGTKIYNNIVEETTGGFMLKQHNDIYNNYTFNLLPGFRPDIMIKKGPVNNGMVKRNICYTNTSRQTVVGAKSKDLFKQADIDSNLFYSAGADGRLHRQYKDDLNANREYQGENSLYADPKFYPVDNRDFRLKPGSPAFGLGIEAINASRIGLLENFPFADTTEGIRRLFIETAERDLSVLRLSRIGAKGELKLTARTETGYLADLSKFEVSFNSQDTELAVVNNQGTVTAKTKGETTIEARVKTNKGTKTIQIAVTVAS